MAMMERQNLQDSSDRPRRLRHESGPNYNGSGDRTLELKEIQEVLNAYHDYEGGINCSLCGSYVLIFVTSNVVPVKIS